jgi:hypothetical protein
MQATRDPRTDPQPGDMLLGVGADGVSRYVQVHYVTSEYVGFARAAAPDAEAQLCRITMDRFREQAQAAEVLS